jgi:WD40 repeat protein
MIEVDNFPPPLQHTRSSGGDKATKNQQNTPTQTRGRCSRSQPAATSADIEKVAFLMPRVLKTLASESEVTSLWWSQLGIIAGGLSGEVSLWPTDDSADGGLCHLGEPVHRSIHILAVLSVCNIGSLIISCSLDGSICQWDGADISEALPTGISDPLQVFPLFWTILFSLALCPVRLFSF